MAGDACDHPDDLSCVADAVFALTGSQGAVVERMDPNRFRTAQPNEGYCLAAALLLEQAVICLMTLNFDLAMAAALNVLGAGSKVAVINGPDDHASIGIINVIYLHRNAYSPPSQWILRTVAMEADWQDHWEQVIVQRVLSSPVTVFAGLGTPARVLIETTRKIRTALPAGTTVYQVGPGPRETSAFFAELGIPSESYLQLTWAQFMKELSDRFLKEQRAELVQHCQMRIQADHIEEENVESLCDRVMAIGMLGSGRLRARWLLERTNYLPQVSIELAWIADLLLAVGLIERKTGTQAVLYDDGIVEFFRDNRLFVTLLFAHGRGVRRWLSIEAELQSWARQYSTRYHRPKRTVLSGVQGTRNPTVSPPTNIVVPENPESIMASHSILEMIDVEELRGNANIANRLADS